MLDPDGKKKERHLYPPLFVSMKKKNLNICCCNIHVLSLISFIALFFSLRSPIYPTDRRGLPLDETLLAEKLSLLGYNTTAVGKWHLGMSQPQYLPERRGFERFYGMVSMSDIFMRWRSSLIRAFAVAWQRRPLHARQLIKGDTSSIRGWSCPGKLRSSSSSPK